MRAKEKEKEKEKVKQILGRGRSCGLCTSPVVAARATPVRQAPSQVDFTKSAKKSAEKIRPDLLQMLGTKKNVQNQQRSLKRHFWGGLWFYAVLAVGLSFRMCKVLTDLENNGASCVIEEGGPFFKKRSWSFFPKKKIITPPPLFCHNVFLGGVGVCFSAAPSRVKFA